jgi:hypothetical protein
VLPCFSRIVSNPDRKVGRVLTSLLTEIHPHTEDLADPANRKPILDKFEKQLAIMKSSWRLGIGRNIIERSLPYTRESIQSLTVSVSTALPPQFSGDSRYEPRNQGREIGTGEVNRTPWPWP